MKKNEILLPTVHLNGTSKDELVNGLRAITAGLDEALRAIQDAWPHGRDYYTQSTDLHAVHAQWAKRRADLHRIRAEFHYMALQTHYPEYDFDLDEVE